jgi:Tfp pilus assembly protein PilN
VLITKNNNWEAGVRKYTVNREFKLGPLSLKFASIALVAIAALFYLAQSSQSATQKYQIMQLQDEKNSLEAQSKDLEVQAARLKSLNEIKKSTQSMEMEPAFADKS